MIDESQGSRACVLTPPGRGAVAVVAVEGPAATDAVDAHFHAANGRRLADQAVDRPVFGHWRHDTHTEEVVVLRGARGVEVHCHGGVAASARILAGLASSRCLVEPWQQRLERTASDPIQAEADLALAAATTRRTAAILLDQRGGALKRAIESARAALIEGRIDATHDKIDDLLQRAPLGLHLTDPWQAAIAGRPNVGKSSLINALVGYQRAIVFDQPGTTRDVLTAETAVDGWPVRLTDAAGLRTTTDSLEAAGVERARETLTRADLVVWVLDATTLAESAAEPAAVARQQLVEEFGSAGELVEPLVVVNKIDLLPSDERRFFPPPVSTLQPPVFLSALTGAGVEDLLAAISQRLVPCTPLWGEPVIFTHRQFDLLAAARGALGAKPSATADLRQAAAAHLDRLLGGS